MRTRGIRRSSSLYPPNPTRGVLGLRLVDDVEVAALFADVEVDVAVGMTSRNEVSAVERVGVCREVGVDHPTRGRLEAPVEDVVRLCLLVAVDDEHVEDHVLALGDESEL